MNIKCETKTKGPAYTTTYFPLSYLFNHCVTLSLCLSVSLSLCSLQQWRNSQTPRETVGVSLRKGNFNTVNPHIHLNNAVYPFH